MDDSKDPTKPFGNYRENLFSINKLEYAKGVRPNVECILCGVKDKNPTVPNLIIAETDLSIVSVNLYPYNPGHLIVFPKRHLLSIVDLQPDEVMDIHNLTKKSIQILTKAWRPSGYNLGYNIGKNSGGSIPNIHEHIVPRFPNEVGFLDIISNTRVVIYDPKIMLQELISLWGSSQD